MLATIVDWSALAKVVEYSLVLGIGVTTVFSLSILGATRFFEMRRDGRMVAAGMFAFVSVVASAVCVAAVVLGIVELAKK